MANYMDVPENGEQEWLDWVATRPKVIQKMALRFRPWILYRMKSTGDRVFLISFSEGGTLTVGITGQYNLIDFDRQVFGIDPDDLEECDLPSPTERLGTRFTRQQVEDNIDLFKATIRPDLWVLDENGKAQRRN